jgi:hypothetical protein
LAGCDLGKTDQAGSHAVHARAPYWEGRGQLEIKGWLANKPEEAVAKPWLLFCRRESEGH